MASVEFHAQGFVEPALNVDYPTPISWNDVFAAAITVGHRDETALWQYGVRSWFEALTRLYRIRMTLEDGPSGTIQFTDLFRAMDPSEKAGVSYYLGLTFCKLYASRHLKCPWLMHHDVYRQYLVSPLARGMRPDLVGLSVDGEWLVFEAKGCRRIPSAKSRKRAKDQAKSLPGVQGQPIKYRIAAWTHITRAGVRVSFEDPPADPPGTPRHGLDLIPEQMIKHYYMPLLTLSDLTAPNDAASGLGSIADILRELGVRIQIEENLLGLLHKQRYREAYHYLIKYAKSSVTADFGLDGIRIQVFQ